MIQAIIWKVYFKMKLHDQKWRPSPCVGLGSMIPLSRLTRKGKESVNNPSPPITILLCLMTHQLIMSVNVHHGQMKAPPELMSISQDLFPKEFHN